MKLKLFLILSLALAINITLHATISLNDYIEKYKAFLSDPTNPITDDDHLSEKDKKLFDAQIFRITYDYYKEHNAMQDFINTKVFFYEIWASILETDDIELLKELFKEFPDANWNKLVNSVIDYYNSGKYDGNNSYFSEGSRIKSILDTLLEEIVEHTNIDLFEKAIKESAFGKKEMSYCFRKITHFCSSTKIASKIIQKIDVKSVNKEALQDLIDYLAHNNLTTEFTELNKKIIAAEITLDIEHQEISSEGEKKITSSPQEYFNKYRNRSGETKFVPHALALGSGLFFASKVYRHIQETKKKDKEEILHSTTEEEKKKEVRGTLACIGNYFKELPKKPFDLVTLMIFLATTRVTANRLLGGNEPIKDLFFF